MKHKSTNYLSRFLTRKERRARAIVFGITNSLYFALGTMLIGFFKHNPDFRGTIVVFHESLSSAQMETLRSIYPHISFRAFQAETVETLLNETGGGTQAKKVLDRYSHFYFAKLELPDLLDEFEKVIWLDVDMLVRGPLDEIWNFEGFTWRSISDAARQKQKKQIRHFTKSENLSRYNGPNGGLIGLNKKARTYGSITKNSLYECFQKFQSQSTSVNADEFSYFLLAQSIGVPVTELELMYNHPSATKGVDNALIVHTIGKQKFWNDAGLKVAYPDWWLWHREWVAIGGEAITPPRPSEGFLTNAANKIVLASRYQADWLNIFDQIVERLPTVYYCDPRTHRAFWQIFFKGEDRNQLHLEVTRLDKNYLVAIHFEKSAANRSDLITEATASLANFKDIKEVTTKHGKSLEAAVPIAKISSTVLEFAEALQNLSLQQRN